MRCLRRDTLNRSGLPAGAGSGFALLATGVLILISALLCYGCASLPRRSVVEDVPFRPQTETNRCGVTALSMTLDYYGIAYNPTNLEEELFVPILNGTPIRLLEETAGRYGLQAAEENLDLQQIHNTLAAGKIVIIYLKPFEGTIGHFAIITGISDNLKKVRIHCQQKPDCLIKASRLLKQSTDNRFPALIITAKPT